MEVSVCTWLFFKFCFAVPIRGAIFKEWKIRLVLLHSWVCRDALFTHSRWRTKWKCSNNVAFHIHKKKVTSAKFLFFLYWYCICNRSILYFENSTKSWINDLPLFWPVLQHHHLLMLFFNLLGIDKALFWKEACMYIVKAK